jgi:hypothetical protein
VVGLHPWFLARKVEGEFPPETQYARSGDVFIAYQVLGDAPLDLVFVPGFVSHLEHYWEAPPVVRFVQRLASFSRLILLDKRETGLSDRVAGIATLEDRMDDVRAVMDTVVSEQAAMFGISEGPNEHPLRRHVPQPDVRPDHVWCVSEVQLLGSDDGSVGASTDEDRARLGCRRYLAHVCAELR